MKRRAGSKRVELPTSKVPTSNCPGCGEPHDAATPATGSSRPTPGAMVVCIRCATPVVFTDDMTLALPSADDPRLDHPELERVRSAIREFWRTR